MVHGYVGIHVIGNIVIEDLFDSLEVQVQGCTGDYGFWTVCATLSLSTSTLGSRLMNHKGVVRGMRTGS